MLYSVSRVSGVSPGLDSTMSTLHCAMMLLLATDGSSPYVTTNHVMDGRNTLTGIYCTPFSHIYIHKLSAYFNLIECNDRKPALHVFHTQTFIQSIRAFNTFQRLFDQLLTIA